MPAVRGEQAHDVDGGVAADGERPLARPVTELPVEMPVVEIFRLVEEDTMPRSRPPYSPEYRQQMVDLVRGGRTPESLSREFGGGGGRFRCRRRGWLRGPSQ